MDLYCLTNKMQNQILILLLHTPSELAELDTAIVGYNQRFPNVGFSYFSGYGVCLHAVFWAVLPAVFLADLSAGC